MNQQFHTFVILKKEYKSEYLINFFDCENSQSYFNFNACFFTKLIRIPSKIASTQWQESKNDSKNSPAHIFNNAKDRYASLFAECDLLAHILYGNFLGCGHYYSTTLWHLTEILHHGYVLIWSSWKKQIIITMFSKDMCQIRW